MTAATVLTILGIINGLIGVATGAPSVIAEAKSLLEKVRPYAHELGVDVATEFTAAEQQLQGMAQ